MPLEFYEEMTMTPLLPILLGSILGVDVGWASAPDGTGERVYIIQIEPDLLDRLKEGEVITSIIDSRAGAVTQFRIQVGEGALPRVPVTATVIDAPETPQVIHSTLPPVPDERVLEISGSPAPAFPAPLAPPGNGPDEEVVFQDDRASTFTVASDASPGTIAFPIDVQESSAELTNDEIQDAVTPFIDEDTPGEFVPSPPVSPANPPEPSPFTGEAAGQESAGDPLIDVAPATYEEIVDALAVKPDQETVGRESARPWLPLTLTFLALLASLGGNAYMGYMFIGLYRRHRKISNASEDDEQADS